MLGVVASTTLTSPVCGSLTVVFGGGLVAVPHKILNTPTCNVAVFLVKNRIRVSIGSFGLGGVKFLTWFIEACWNAGSLNFASKVLLGLKLTFRAGLYTGSGNGIT